MLGRRDHEQDFSGELQLVCRGHDVELRRLGNSRSTLVETPQVLAEDRQRCVRAGRIVLAIALSSRRCAILN
jgi:hypothetical protein